MVTIEPADVIRLIEQYLKENNLLKTLQCLQEESSVSLNAVDSIDTFVNDINSGHWDVVLRIVKFFRLPDKKLMDLYEQIAIELIELRETRAANWLINKTEPIMKLKSDRPERYLHLQNLLARSYFDPKEAYRDGSSKERRRASIANDLKKEVTVAPPQRLMTLIGDALKWQKHEGSLPSSTSIDIFTGKAHMKHADEETHPNTLHKHCVKPVRTLDKNGDEDGTIFVCSAEFSPDGHYLVIGYSTGFVEIRNSTTGRLASDLKFQAENRYVVTPSKKAALSICFSVGDMFAVGDKSGDISVWKLDTGQSVIIMKSAHLKSVSCLTFHRNGREILSGGHDGSLKLHGMRSGKTIRDFKGHKSYVYGVAYSHDDNFIVSGGSDCIVRVWNARTAQLLHEYKSPNRVHTISLMPNLKDDIFLVGDRSRNIYLIDLEAKVRHEFHDDQPAEAHLEKSDETSDDVPKSKNFYAACSSPKGGWIYAVDSQYIYCFNYSTKRVQKRLLAHENIGNDLIGVKHHPFLNMLATYDTIGNLKLWVP